MTIRRPYAGLLIFSIGLCLALAQYPNPPGNSQRQLPVPPSAAAKPKETAPSHYSNGGGATDGRPPYPYRPLGQQQQNPSGQFSANTDPFQNSNDNNPAADSLSTKLEQQLRPQNREQQQTQQQKSPTGRYENNNGAGSNGNSGSPTINGGYGGGGYGISGGRGVNIQVQLKAYANPERQIGQGRLCSCPAANQECMNKSPFRAGYPCLFSFIVVVASDDAVVHHRSTPYLLLNANGQIAQESLPSFQRPIDFQLDGEPSSINVFVTSLGAVLDSAGNLVDWNTVTEVETFVKSLRDGAAAGAAGGYSSSGSSGSYQQPQQINLVDTQLGTQLSLTYTVTCRNTRLVGPGCDLFCNRSAVNSGSAICVSARTGYFSLCRWTAGNSQVSECKNCPWGIEENAYCRDENGGVLEANHAGVVSEGYQTATIIFAIIAGILAFCLLVTCVYVKACLPKKGQTTTKSRTPPACSSNASQPAAAGPTIYLKHDGESEPPVATGGVPLPPRSGHIGQHFLPPLPPNGKAKASLRSPLLFPMPPPPHSLNNTMNSSFTGSHAPNAPPSVSADV